MNRTFGQFQTQPLYTDTVDNKKRERAISNRYKRHLKCEHITILGSCSGNMGQYSKQLVVYMGCLRTNIVETLA